MPHKFNDARRDKIPKTKYRVSNWSAYNECLRQRGDLTVWVADDVAQNWAARRCKTRGGQARYSDLAIEVFLTENAGGILHHVSGEIVLSQMG